jgi:8-oxo-dGTP diphosphatase
MIHATLCYIKKDDSVLLVEVTKEGFNKGKWNGVGGKFDDGEDWKACAIREVKEETGLEIFKPTLIGIIDFPDNLSSGNDWRVYVVVADKFGGELIADSAEGNLEWIKVSDVLNLKMNKADYIFLPWIFKGKEFKATFNTDGEIIESKSLESSTKF